MVRISGPDALSISEKVFIPGKPSRKESHRLYHGFINNPKTGRKIDEALLAYMKAPASYTGEDIIEISCHGGTAVLSSVLGAILDQGARLADRGEFTKRAFLNGKIDLAQAEAVIDLIKAKTSIAASVSASQLFGSLSSKIGSLREKILSTLAGIEASLDFPDDVSAGGPKQLRGKLEGPLKEINRLLDTAEAGRILRAGIRAAIIGKPNVGKSSLLNALLKTDRAIVSPHPGTTRDTIEETANIKGMPVVVIDTAGIRDAGDGVERQGINRAKDAARGAELVIAVIDSSQRLTQEDLSVLGEIKNVRGAVALNKADLPRATAEKDIKKHLPGSPIFLVSALHGAGVSALEDGLFELMSKGAKFESDSVAINTRHKHCLIRAKEALERAFAAARTDKEEALISIDMKEAASALGEVTGEVVTDEVLEKIFSDFCVGK